MGLATSHREKSEAMLKFIQSTLLFLLLSLFVCPHSHGQEYIRLEDWLRQAEDLLERTEDYTAIFHKQERVKGWLKTKETVYLRFKKPFKVHMKWIDGPGKGREVFYVEGWNKNRILVREPGALGTVTLNLNPLGPLAMQGSRHPITEAGLEHLIKLFVDNFRKGWMFGELEYGIGRGEMLYGRRTLTIEARFPKEPRNGYYCYRTIMNLDLEKKIPIRVQVFDWEDRLVGDYGYENIMLNAGLTDADFKPRDLK